MFDFSNYNEVYKDLFSDNITPTQNKVFDCITSYLDTLSIDELTMIVECYDIGFSITKQQERMLLMMSHPMIIGNGRGCKRNFENIDNNKNTPKYFEPVVKETVGTIRYSVYKRINNTNIKKIINNILKEISTTLGDERLIKSSEKYLLKYLQTKFKTVEDYFIAKQSSENIFIISTTSDGALSEFKKYTSVNDYVHYHYAYYNTTHDNAVSVTETHYHNNKCHNDAGPAYLKYEMDIDTNEKLLVKLERFYTNGNVTKSIEYNKDGWVCRRTTYDNEKNTSLIMDYNKNGGLIKKQHVKNGDFHCENGPALIEYYDNGSIMMEHYYVDGYYLDRGEEPNNIEYHPNGVASSKRWYLNGSVFKIEFYNKKGDLHDDKIKSAITINRYDNKKLVEVQKHHYKNGKKHNSEDAAVRIEMLNDNSWVVITKQYFLRGKELSKEEFEAKLKLKKQKPSNK